MQWDCLKQLSALQNILRPKGWAATHLAVSLRVCDLKFAVPRVSIGSMDFRGQDWHYGCHLLLSSTNRPNPSAVLQLADPEEPSRLLPFKSEKGLERFCLDSCEKISNGGGKTLGYSMLAKIFEIRYRNIGINTTTWFMYEKENKNCSPNRFLHEWLYWTLWYTNCRTSGCNWTQENGCSNFRGATAIFLAYPQWK